MNHSEIQNQDIIERYVCDQLSEEERRAFQEHFFTCDDCFANVQMTERFVAGIQHGAEAGLLAEETTKQPAAHHIGNWYRWLKPAFATAALVAVMLAATVGWLVFVRLPALHNEVERERQAREQLEKQKQQEIDELNARLAQQQSSVQPGQESARNEDAGHRKETKPAPPNIRSAQENTSELLAQNVPVVVLQATRASQDTSELRLPASARRFVCWIEVSPQTQFASFRVEVFTADGVLASRFEGLRKNARNAIVANLPAQSFASGDYLVKLYGVGPNQATLIGEYKLHLEKK